MAQLGKSHKRTVLVIGAGVAGAACAKSLAQGGLKVHLIDKEAAIGGHAADMGCKATNVCLRCNVCVAHDVLKDVAAMNNVTVHTCTELTELAPGAKAARYQATLAHTPCHADGQESPLAPAGPAPKPRATRLDVDNIVIATGFSAYDPAENNLYGYGLAANVITGLQAEQQLAQQNKIIRPSDGQPPKRLAFIQCVGSRTEEIFRRPDDTDYCSAVCCAYALRTARQIKYQADDCDITIFYMDIQNFGKGFDEFHQQCKGDMRFVRSRPYQVTPGKDGAVAVQYAPPERTDKEAPSVRTEQFDLVVLAVGMRPGQHTTELAEKLRLPTDESGFLGLKDASAVADMQRDGFFVIGAAESPKDMAGSIAQAQAVSAAIISEDQ